MRHDDDPFTDARNPTNSSWSDLSSSHWRRRLQEDINQVFEYPNKLSIVNHSKFFTLQTNQRQKNNGKQFKHRDAIPTPAGVIYRIELLATEAAVLQK